MMVPNRTICGVSALVSLLSILAISPEAARSEPSGPTIRVKVVLVLLEAPSNVQQTADLFSIGPIISGPSQLQPGGKVYLEPWCQTPGPNGITTAVVDLTYDTTYFDTSAAQVQLAPQWNTLAFGVSVNEAEGIVENLGGNNFSGLGVAPQWAKIGTVELDVTGVPAASVALCSLFAGQSDGGFPLEFGIQGEGAVDPAEVDYGCFTVGCEADLNGFSWFFSCVTGPDGMASNACACADADGDGDVDFNDFGVFQVAFTELWCCPVAPPP